MKKLTLIIIVAGLCLGWTSTSLAETYTLRYGGHLPIEHPTVKYQVKWMRSIEKATAGRVKFQEFHAGSLINARSAAKEIRKGTADLGGINAPAERDQFPISSQTLAFFYGDVDWITNAKIYKQVMNEFPEWKKEFDGLKPLCFESVGNFNLVSKVPIRTLDDFKGLQLRTIGPYMSYTFKQLGASPVAVPPSEVYVSLQKNIVDGVVKGDDAVKADALAEVAGYTIELNAQAGGGSVFVMNEKSFQRLPEDIQAIIDLSLEGLQADFYTAFSDYLDQANKFAQQYNHERIQLSKDDMDRLYKYLDDEAILSAKQLDEKGLPGTKIYRRIRELMAQSK